MKTIQLAKTINVEDCFYLYDARCNVIIAITENDYNEINNYISKPSEELLSDIIRQIQELGMLKPGGVKNRFASIDQNLDKMYTFSKNNAVPQKLIIEVTEQCNLRCKYCMYTKNEDTESSIRKHNNSCIDTTVAMKAIENYFSSYESIVMKIPTGNIQ